MREGFSHLIGSCLMTPNVIVQSFAHKGQS